MNRLIVILLAANLAVSALLLWRTRTPETNQAFEWPEIEAVTAVSYTYKAELVRVIDGDTVVLDIDLGFETWLRNQPIRLFGLNTPEITGQEKPEGLKAKAWLEERLSGHEIVLQSIQDKKEGFGRWLGILHADGANVNDEMLESGIAEKFMP